MVRLTAIPVGTVGTIQAPDESFIKSEKAALVQFGYLFSINFGDMEIRKPWSRPVLSSCQPQRGGRRDDLARQRRRRRNAVPGVLDQHRECHTARGRSMRRETHERRVRWRVIDLGRAGLSGDAVRGEKG